MGVLVVQIMVFICGLMAILFSILAWRLRNDVYFYLGIAFTGIFIIYGVYNYLFLWSQWLSGNVVFVLFNLAFVGLPIFFLIKAKTPTSNSSLDGVKSGGPVTEEYLDEIINSPDEEIDFEDGLNLK